MDLEQKKSFAVRLAKLREERNLTQQELADETKILRVTIAKYESQKRIPSFEDLTTLAIYFNTTTDYFLGLTNIARIETPNDEKIKIACDYTGLSEEAVKKLASMKSEEFDNQIDILSWLISQEYALELCTLLYDIDSVSEFYESDLERYQEKFNNFEEQIKINHYTTVTQFDELELLNDDLNAAFDKIDVARYRLIRFTESLANLYDNRKQTNSTKNVPELLFTVNKLRREDDMTILWNYLKDHNMLRKENPDNGNDNKKDE